jgi:asparagine synthase (glutamine-hydrolysing)
LGHVRLSIIDLSPSGDQPFHDAQDDIHAVVNGELYDYEHYRAQFAKEYNFKGNSDCEIVIALYRHYGISFLSHLRGEFALVLWLFAARDRFGIKSLYYTIVAGQLLVATEMKSFLPLGWKPEWSIKNLRDKSWFYSANTIFENVYSV